VGAVARPGPVVLGLATLALLTACSGSVEIDGHAPPEADRGPCRALLDALPAEVADLSAREVSPDDAWGAAWGDPPIVLRCGVGEPEGYDAVATCTTVEGIDWYLPEEPPEGDADVTMTTVNREPAVEVRLPVEHWPPATAMVDLAPVLEQHTERTGRCR
jgi:hypothetical protein